MVGGWWYDDDLSYGLLVAPGVAYIAYRYWQEHRPPPALAPTRIAGLAVVAVGVFGGLALTSVGKGGGSALTLVVALWGLALYRWGWVAARDLLAPAGLLLLTNPKLADLLMMTLTWRGQLCCSAGAAMIGNLCGLHIQRVGVNLHLPNALIVVAKECSGVRTFVGVLALVAILACLAKCDWWRKAALVGLSVPVALVINTLRLATIVFVGHWAGQEAANVWHLRLMLPTAVAAAALALYCGKWVGCTVWEPRTARRPSSLETTPAEGSPAPKAETPGPPRADDDELEL
jgi:exosortase